MNMSGPLRQDSIRPLILQSVIPGSQNIPGKKIGDYIFTNLLGKGAFGEVFQAYHISTNENVAVKCVPKIKLKEHNGLVGELLKTEVSVLDQCNNPNVIRLVKYLETQNQCYLIIEFCNQGDFEVFWKSKGSRIPEKEAVAYMKQILNGMRGLHELNVIHRDLKLANILIHNGILKIADLGFAQQLRTKDDQVQLSLGSLGNMAPEVIEGKRYGILADMFSIGSIYYQLLFGTFPFSIQNHQAFLKDIQLNQPNFFKNGVQISLESRSLLTNMLQYDPAKRLKWTELYNHPLINDQSEGFRYNQLTFNNLAAQKLVNVKENQEIYKKNEEKLNQVDNKNMFDMIKTNKTKEEQKIQQVDDDDEDTKSQYGKTPQDGQYLQKIQQLQKEEREREIEVNKVIEQYFAIRNRNVYIARTFESIPKIQHKNATNVLFPAFMLIKKLIVESNDLIIAIGKNKNIFNTKYFQQLYQSSVFENFYMLIQEELPMFQLQFGGILDQCKDGIKNIKNMQSLLESQKKELTDVRSEQFNDIYGETLLNYYIQIQDEISGENDKEIVCQKSNLQFSLLDCIQFDTKLKAKFQTPDFSLDQYLVQLSKITQEEKDKLIAAKLNEMCC